MTGLTTPRGWAQGGRPARPKVVQRTSRTTRDEHRWVRAEDVKVEDRLVGNRGGVYRVLGIAHTVDHRLAFIVEAPSGSIRTWIRSLRFSMERP